MFICVISAFHGRQTKTLAARRKTGAIGAEFSGDEAGQGAVPVVALDAGEEGLEVAGDQSVQSSALGPPRGAR